MCEEPKRFLAKKKKKRFLLNLPKRFFNITLIFSVVKYFFKIIHETDRAKSLGE